MSQFIDRRLNSKNKSAVNRQRFMQRFKSQIKQAVSNVAGKRSITDMERGEKISIPTKEISEPKLHHGYGGRWEFIHPGNKEFIAGDHIPRETNDDTEESKQGGKGESNWDDFHFELSREEFLELFFDDLALPNLVKKRITEVPNIKYVKAGFTLCGNPANLSIIRSLRAAYARRIALGGPCKTQLEAAEEELHLLLQAHHNADPMVLALQQKIESLKKKINSIAFIDPIDLRYHNRIPQQIPSTCAVMFCLMDVSGSMDELKKDIAKRFFILLYLFLTRHYRKIDLVFIRHHTVAKEVDEYDFFYSRETGGTVVSSALEKMNEIIQERYPKEDWNIYAAQASDGDNWSADSPYCRDLIQNQLMAKLQYYAYVEIMPRYHQSLWESYAPIKDQFANFAMQTINDLTDIYPVFRNLFKKESV